MTTYYVAVDLPADDGPPTLRRRAGVPYVLHEGRLLAFSRMLPSCGICRLNESCDRMYREGILFHLSAEEQQAVLERVAAADRWSGPLEPELLQAKDFGQHINPISTFC